jgi:phage-related protein
VSQPIDTAHVEIVPELDRFAAKLKNELDRALKGLTANINTSLKDVDRSFRKAGEHTGKGFGERLRDGLSTALRGLSTTLKPALIGVTATAAGQLAVALAPLTGAVALLPAALLGAATALGTLKLAFSGVGDALKAGLSGDTDKLAEAMANLAPAAQEAVRGFLALRPQLDQLRRSVQGAFFGEFAGQIRGLGQALLPVLNDELSATAAALGRVVSGLLAFAGAPATLAAVRETLSNSGLAAANFADALGNVFRAFLPVAQVGSRFLPDLAAALDGASLRLAAFTQRAADSGQLATFIQGALDGFRSLGAVLAPIGSILVSVFAAIQESGSGALGAVGALLDQLAALFKTPAGAGALTGLFSVLGQVASLFGSTLAAVLPAAAGLITDLAVALGPLIDALTSGLVPIVGNLVTKLGTALTPVIDALGTALGQVLDAAAPLLDLLGAVLGDILTALAPVVAEVARMFGNVLAQALTALTPLFATLLPVVAQLASSVLPALLPLVGLLGNLLLALMPAIKPLVNLLVTVLVPILKLLGVVITNVVAPALGFIVAAITPAITAVASFIGWLAKGLASAGTWRAVGDFFVGVWNRIKEAFADGLRRLGAFVDFMRGLPGRILAAVGNLGGLLFDAGRNVIQGLINGIKSAIGRVKDTLASVTRLIPDWKGPEDKDRRILRPAGRALIEGFGLGVDEQVPALRRQLLALTGDLPLTLNGSAAGAGAGQSIVFQPGAIQVSFEGVVPTPAQATQTAEIISAEVAETLARQAIRSRVRVI